MSGKQHRIIKLGERFGRWEVLACSDKLYHFVCRCDCGNKSNVDKYNLLKGYSTQCNECRKDMKKSQRDYLGKRFGHWSVLSYLSRGKWKIQCDCGKERIVLTSIITALKSKLNCSCIKCTWSNKIDQDRLTLIEVGLAAGLSESSISRLLGITKQRINQIVKTL